MTVCPVKADVKWGIGALFGFSPLDPPFWRVHFRKDESFKKGPSRGHHNSVGIHILQAIEFGGALKQHLISLCMHGPHWKPKGGLWNQRMHQPIWVCLNIKVLQNVGSPLGCPLKQLSHRPSKQTYPYSRRVLFLLYLEHACRFNGFRRFMSQGLLSEGHLVPPEDGVWEVKRARSVPP